MNEPNIVTNANASDNNLFNLFADDDAFQKLFADCLEANAAPTSKAIENSYRSMIKLFNEYLEAIQENMFRYAYQCGFKAALKKRMDKD